MSYPAPLRAQMSAQRDAFRNPAGHIVRQSLTALVRELLGAMDRVAVDEALDALIRLRAVQNFSPAEALRFIFELRSVLVETCGEVTAKQQGRIDEMAMAAFDHYMHCREQIHALRMKELRLHATFGVD